MHCGVILPEWLCFTHDLRGRSVLSGGRERLHFLLGGHLPGRQHCLIVCDLSRGVLLLLHRHVLVRLGGMRGRGVLSGGCHVMHFMRSGANLGSCGQRVPPVHRWSVPGRNWQGVVQDMRARLLLPNRR
jgi:hypothetical protein